MREVPPAVEAIEPWNVRLRALRGFSNLYAKEVLQGTDIGLSSYYASERGERRLSRSELAIIVKNMDIDPEIVADFPMRGPRVRRVGPKDAARAARAAATFAITTVPEENINVTDLLKAVNTKMARFRELHIILQQYDSLKEEYDALKSQLSMMME